MEIKRVLNDGKNIIQGNAITFLTSKGYRTPNYIWCDMSNNGIELYGMTKKSCIAAIDRDNRLF